MKIPIARILLVVLMVAPFLISGIAIVQNTNIEISTIEPMSSHTISRVPHSSISIYGNNDFNQTAISEGWAGNGSEIDPFIIEGYIISTDWTCISIYDTSFYYVIRDCEFTRVSEDDGTYALVFENSPHGTLNASDTHDKVGGLLISRSPGFTVMNSNFSDFEPWGGLEIYLSSYCVIENNTFTNTGVEITGYTAPGWQHTFFDNTVNGKPLCYFHNESELFIDGGLYGQIILAECTNCTVSGASISHATSAIALGHCVECYLLYNEVSQNRFGILLSECESVYAINNTIGPYNEYGIHLNDSMICMVQGNTVFDNFVSGIDCIGGMVNMVFLNTVSGNGYYGIDCWEGMGFIIYNNTVFENNDGISVCAPYSQILYNIVQNNTGVGITLGGWGDTICFVYGNSIGWNAGGNAFDTGSSNFWDNGENMGNFWSDYSGTGTYPIPGDAGSVDHYPFKLVTEEPTTTLTPTTTTPTTTTTTTTGETGNNTTTETPTGTLDSTLILITGGVAAGLVIVVIIFLLKRK